ncbi:MAG: response regulator [Ferruginibacter sp.]
MLRRNLIVGFGVTLLLLIISSLASYISITRLIKSNENVRHNTQVLQNFENLMFTLQDAETGQRGYLLSGDEIFLESYIGSYDKMKIIIAKLRTLYSVSKQSDSFLDTLESLSIRRISHMKERIMQRREGQIVSMEGFRTGKNSMDSIREFISRVERQEEEILGYSTGKLKTLANSTTVFIILASLISIFITIFSFYRVLDDFKKKQELQNSLMDKDENVSQRIGIIERVAAQISDGDYTTVVDDSEGDVLGSLAGALNKMSYSLHNSFETLNNKEWIQSGIAQLNDNIIGEKDLEKLTQKVLSFITSYTDSVVGAFFLVNNYESLQLYATISLNKKPFEEEVPFGQGSAGSVAISGKPMLTEDIQDSRYHISFTSGNLKPSAIYTLPVYHEKTLKGILEIGALEKFPERTIEFITQAVYGVGIAIHSARDHQRLQELLAETQAQSEELHAQHSELENINTELHAQAEKLQASEEELRVQQEELQQSNQEMEERSRLLEEKNEMILERNLEIQQKAEELTQSTKYKSEFLANMSHELRTPLNSILLLSRLLSENHSANLSDEQIEYANVIQHSGASLLTLIDEILDLSKIESGKMELDYADVSLHGLGNDLNALFTPIAKDKGIEFKIEYADNVPGIFETDRLRVEQILRNLISNALKFTRKGSVTLMMKEDAGLFHLAVTDTGIGIPKNKQETIFEAFQQADGSTKREFGGTGLGLSISRQLALLLGGEIAVESVENEGSTFTLLLPMGRHMDKSILEQEKPEKNEAVKKEEYLIPGREFISDVIPPSVPDDREDIEAGDRIILIIEDDVNFAKSLRDYTKRNGYKCIVAVRGDEGIDLAKKYLPTGILLDIQLPVKSGWEVMDELKSFAETRPIPVHMMSNLEAKTKSLTKGAVDFINKPVAFEQLAGVFKKIEEALSRDPKKVLIVEDNEKHAAALSYFLQSFNVQTEIKRSVDEGIEALNTENLDCVILDMGIPAQHSYDTLEAVKKTPGLENLPIIIFTGKNLSHLEEMKIKQYADSIVIKTAHSYQRILDEVSLFLHLVDENKKDKNRSRSKQLGTLSEVLKDKTVLLADDDVRNIFSLTKSLETYGMKVISAIDGKDALKQLDDNKGIDIVLMDMMMPEMDGYETTQHIRQHHKYKKLPVIAVTAKAMTGDREKCIASGASDYITKPVDIDQLLSLLRVWLYD